MPGVMSFLGSQSRCYVGGWIESPSWLKFEVLRQAKTVESLIKLCGKT